MIYSLRIKIFLGFILFIGHSWGIADECKAERHALYDLGSGSTKVVVVETDSCQLGAPKLLLNTASKVDYKLDLTRSQDSSFSKKIQQQGLTALVGLKKQALAFLPTTHQGVATAAFRQAKNADAFTKEILKKHQIQIQIVTQEEEALLGYHAALAASPQPATPKPVWDIGGGSFQIIIPRPNKTPEIIKGNLASVSFNTQLKAHLKIPDTSSINPLGEKNLKLARKFAKNSIRETLGKSQIPQSLRTQVIGIGGVHSKSIRSWLKKEVYTYKDLDLWIQQNLSKHNSEFDDPYAETLVTNMILVSEMMKSLKIKEVLAIDAEMVTGLLYLRPRLQL